jgi:hypothetical protein
MADKLLTGTVPQIATIRAALNTAAGLPLRGVTYGGPDRVHPSIPGPGWTTQCTPEPVAVDANTCALEIPSEVEQHLGKRVGAVQLPARATLVDEASLPVALRTAVRGSKGLAADGTPKPLQPAVADSGKGGK